MATTAAILRSLSIPLSGRGALLPLPDPTAMELAAAGCQRHPTLKPRSDHGLAMDAAVASAASATTFCWIAGLGNMQDAATPDSIARSSWDSRTSAGEHRSRRNGRIHYLLFSEMNAVLQSSESLRSRWNRKLKQRGRAKEQQFILKVQKMLIEDEKKRIHIAQGLPWTTDEPEEPAHQEQVQLEQKVEEMAVWGMQKVGL